MLSNFLSYTKIMSNEKKQNRIDRFKELAWKAEQKSQAAFERSSKMVEGIPAGQPILVGHHSEKRHRSVLERSWNAVEQSVKEQEKAEYYRRKAEAAENNNAIYTEDEDSVKRLEEKIAAHEKLQLSMKDRNKIVRKKITDDEKVAELVKTGMKESVARALLVPDFCGRIGYPICTLTNNNAVIRNAKKRLEQVKQLKAQERKEYDVNGAHIVENPQENRFQIYFRKKPAENIRQSLHHAGYRYSYENGCWQCYMKRWNIEAGKKILLSIGEE